MRFLLLLLLLLILAGMRKRKFWFWFPWGIRERGREIDVVGGGGCGLWLLTIGDGGGVGIRWPFDEQDTPLPPQLSRAKQSCTIRVFQQLWPFFRSRKKVPLFGVKNVVDVRLSLVCHVLQVQPAASSLFNSRRIRWPAISADNSLHMPWPPTSKMLSNWFLLGSLSRPFSRVTLTSWVVIEDHWPLCPFAGGSGWCRATTGPLHFFSSDAVIPISKPILVYYW